MASGEKQFLNSKEGRAAVELGRELAKRYRLNRRSARVKLGVENPKKGKQ